MRIISGIFKGKKLIQPIDKNTRPLKDITKESIFNLILHSKKINLNLEQLNILDLFSGTGSFGLECLSRNAKFVTFVENYKPACEILKRNILLLNLKENFKIIEQNIYNKDKYYKIGNNFDIIFADPPYKEEKIKDLLQLIANNKILKKNGLLILHRNKKKTDVIPKYFKIIEERFYGVSKIIFLKLK